VDLNSILTAQPQQFNPPMQISIVVKFFDLSGILTGRDRAYERRIIARNYVITSAFAALFWPDLNFCVTWIACATANA
jgi:hypothetical protein